MKMPAGSGHEKAAFRRLLFCQCVAVAFLPARILRDGNLNGVIRAEAYKMRPMATQGEHQPQLIDAAPEKS